MDEPHIHDGMQGCMFGVKCMAAAERPQVGQADPAMCWFAHDYRKLRVIMPRDTLGRQDEFQTQAHTQVTREWLDHEL